MAIPSEWAGPPVEWAGLPVSPTLPYLRRSKVCLMRAGLCSDLLIVYDVVDADWLQSVTYWKMIGLSEKELFIYLLINKVTIG